MGGGFVTELEDNDRFDPAAYDGLLEDWQRITKNRRDVRGCDECPMLSENWCRHPEAPDALSGGAAGVFAEMTSTDLPSECPLRKGPLLIELAE